MAPAPALPPVVPGETPAAGEGLAAGSGAARSQDLRFSCQAGSGFWTFRHLETKVFPALEAGSRWKCPMKIMSGSRKQGADAVVG